MLGDTDNGGIAPPDHIWTSDERPGYYLLCPSLEWMVPAAVLTDGSSEEEQGLVRAAFAGLPKSAPGLVLVARFAAWRAVRVLRKYHSPPQGRVWGYILLAAKAPLPEEGRSSSGAPPARTLRPRPKPAPLGSLSA